MINKLFAWLNSIRGKFLSQSDATAVKEIAQQPPSPETARLMRRLKNARAMLTVKIAGSDEAYLSALLEVNDEEGYIVLDELNSKSGHRILSRVKHIEISTRLEDRDIKFICDVTAIGEERGIAFYKVPFPVDLNHQLRRKFLRITTPKGKYLPVHLHTEAQDLVTGQLVDLSTGGFGALLNRETSSLVHRGDFVPRCMLYLGDHDPIETEIEVRYCEDKQYSKTPRLGGKFVNMHQNDERRLQRYISHLDRLKVRNLNIN